MSPSAPLSPEQHELVERIVDATVRKRASERVTGQIIEERAELIQRAVATDLKQVDLARVIEDRLEGRDWTRDDIKGSGILLDSIRRIVKAGRAGTK